MVRTSSWLPTTYAVAQLVKYCATTRNVAGSIPDVVIRIFHSRHSTSSTTYASWFSYLVRRQKFLTRYCTIFVFLKLAVHDL